MTAAAFWKDLVYRYRHHMVLGTVALVALAFLLLVGMTTFAIRAGAKLAGIELRLEGTRWHGVSGLELDGVAVGEYFTADAIRLDWKWKWLLAHHRLHLIELVHPQIYLNELNEAFPETAADQGEEKTEGDPVETIRRLAYQLRIDHGVIWIGPFGPGLPRIRLALGRQHPIEWTTGSLNKVDDQNEPLQVAEASEIRIYSPINPMAPVLDLGTIRLTFTWRGLERHEISGISVVAPTLYIGPNLFAFFDAVQKPPSSAEPTATAAPQGAPWIVQNFALTGGTLRITAFGDPGVVLPFTFRSSGEKINLADLDSLRLHNRIEINQKTFDYPSYGVSITGFTGQLDFNIPPSHHAQNVVQWIKLQGVSWKGMQAQDVFATVTFDKNGISGDLGGKLYGGYLSGNYSVGFTDGFPWHAGLYLDHAEVKEPVEKLAHGDFHLQGKAGFAMTVDAKSRDIEACRGDFSFPQGGLLQIPAASQVGQSMEAKADGPPWRNELQGQMVQRVMESFSYYPFTTGKLSFLYGVPVTTLQLNLEGSAGRRNFEIAWNQEGKEGIILPKKTPPKVSVRVD